MPTLITPKEHPVCSVTLNGTQNNDLPIKGIYVRKEVNKIPVAKITFAESYAYDTKSLIMASMSDLNPGVEIEISLGYGEELSPVFKGKITGQESNISKFKTELTITCRDIALKMAVSPKSTTFEESTDSDAISQMIDENGLTGSIEETEVEHQELIQNNCTDWDFILTRTMANNMAVFVNDGEIEIKPFDLSGEPTCEIDFENSIIKANTRLNVTEQVQNVKAFAWNVDSQELIEAESSETEELPQGVNNSMAHSEVLGITDYNIQSSANLDQDELQTWATAVHQRAIMAQIKGDFTCYGNSDLKSGDLLSITGFAPNLDGNAFIGGIEHKFESGSWSTKVLMGLENITKHSTDKSSDIISPIQGLTTGIVKELEGDPSGQFKIRIAIPSLQTDNIGVWARISNGYASEESGVFFLPEIDDEVIVGFINQDPRNPIVLGSVHNSNTAPPYPIEDDNFKKGIITKNQLKVEFDEEDDVITISTPEGNILTLNDTDKLVSMVDLNGNSIEMTEDGITITSCGDLNITSSGATNLESTADISLTSSANVAVEGINVEAKGSAKFAAEGAMAEIKGSAQTIIKGGMVMIN